MSDIQIHVIDPESAYAQTQTDDEIKDGDVLVIPSLGIVGFLYLAWPTAIIYDPDSVTERNGVADTGFGTLNWESKNEPDHPANTYEASIIRCCEIAEADADITGNDDWPQLAKSVREMIG